MKKFLASLVIAVAAMCFAPTAGAVEMAALPQGVEVETFAAEPQVQSQERGGVVVIIADEDSIIIIIIH